MKTVYTPQRIIKNYFWFNRLLLIEGSKYWKMVACIFLKELFINAVK